MDSKLVNQRAFTLTNAMLIDPENDYEGLGSITIDNGMISSINGTSIGKEIDCNQALLAPGIIDMGVKICEPGERHKESFKSASLAAATGGVTTMVTRPDTTQLSILPKFLSSL